jgi:RNA polymerase sigma factor (sigma-70 family)
MDHVSDIRSAAVSALGKTETDVRPTTTGHFDAELLQLFLNRADQAAFTTLINRHGPMVLGVCRRILRNEADADDAFQATFLVLATRGRSIRSRTSLADWLFGVALRTAKKARTASVRRRNFMERLMRMHRPSSDKCNAEGLELQTILDEEIRRLPQNYRKVVLLCWLEGKSKSAAARELGWPQGTVATRIAKARDLLRTRLQSKGLFAGAAALNGSVIQQLASTTLPAALSVSTTRAAGLLVAGKSAAHIASIQAMKLAEGVSRAMFIAKVRIIAAFLLVLLLATNGVLRAMPKYGVDPKADAMLDQMIAQLEALQSYAMHVDHTMTIVQNHIEGSKNLAGWIASTDIRAEPGKFDETSQTWDLRPGDTKPHPQFDRRWIWDGRRIIGRQQYRGDPKAKLLATVSSHAPESFLFDDSGQVLHGVAYGDSESAAKVMRKSAVAGLRAPEMVQGHSCQVIEAKTARGTYTLWVDPNAGYLFRRARIVKHSGDLFYGDKLPADGTSRTVTGIELDINDVDLTEIDGHFVAMGCTTDWKTFVGSDGQYRLDHSTFKRSRFEFNPNFPSLGAFAMDGIAEGSRILSLDKDGPYVRSIMTWSHSDVVISGTLPERLPKRTPRVGDVALAIQGVDMNGKSMNLSEYRGKVVVLNFWSSSCPPCMAMVPHETELVRKMAGKRFVLLGVNVWDTHETAAATIAKEHMTWPSWFDGRSLDSPIAKNWDVHEIPSIFVIDAKGIIRYEDVRSEELDQAVYALLKEVE